MSFPTCGQGTQAKILSSEQIDALVEYVLDHTRDPLRNRVIVLLSFRAGLRAKEIAALTWAMVTDVEGRVADELRLPNMASKGKTGGRTVPFHPRLKEALLDLKAQQGETAHPEAWVVYPGVSANYISIWFMRVYRELGYEGASSHSGRRTFITALAKLIVTTGGSLRDVQELAGHSSLDGTQRYIQGDAVAKRAAIERL